MTREEELDWLCRLRSKIYVYMPKEWLIPMNNALDMAIKALEQPITDVNSNVLHKISEFFSSWDGDETAKIEISVNDMREIADIFRRKARAERQLKEIKPIGYRECSDAMLKMWMDNVLTDGEYYRIMDKLNAKWSKMNEVTE